MEYENEDIHESTVNFGIPEKSVTDLSTLNAKSTLDSNSGTADDIFMSTIISNNCENLTAELHAENAISPYITCDQGV